MGHYVKEIFEWILQRTQCLFDSIVVLWFQYKSVVNVVCNIDNYR